jgi:hypothetical protein
MSLSVAMTSPLFFLLGHDRLHRQPYTPRVTRRRRSFTPASILHDEKGHVRSIPKLGRGALSADRFKKGALDFTKCPSVSMLPVSKGSPESEYLGAPKWTEDNGHGVKLLLTAEVVKHRSS